jgi:hypothetical protein
MVEEKETTKVVSTEEPCEVTKLEACQGKEKPCEGGNTGDDSGK